MKHLAAMFVLLALAGAALALEQGKEVGRLQSGAAVIKEIMGTPEKGIPRDLLNKAVCVGVIPSEKKFALGFGGSYGRGELVCRRGGNGAWGAPSMFALRGGSVGLQLGGSATDVVFIVMNGKGAQKLVADKTELGADVAAAAGPVGRTTSGATDLQMHAEILTYSRSRGLFAGISLKGSAVTQDRDANQRLYRRKLDAKEILFGRARVPAAGSELDAVLTSYSPRGGEKFTPK